jgi:uncharacterized repeat protein (TIGR03803 family)
LSVNGGTHGKGMVYRLKPPVTGKTWTLEVLHNFTEGNGAAPDGGVIADAGRNLYGASVGAVGAFSGEVWELSPPAKNATAWTLMVLHKFSKAAGGEGPGGIVMDRTGVLYGMTGGGGKHDLGTAFKLTPAKGEWKETVLYDFDCRFRRSRPGIPI